MEVDSEGLPSMISNGDDDGLPPLCQSHHEDDDDDGDFPMPEQSTSPKQHVRASRQRKGGDKLRQGWTASRKQPGGGRTVPVPGIAFVPNLRSPMAPSTPEAAAAGSLQGGEGERPSGEEEEEEEDRGKPGPRELDDPEPRAQQQQGEQEEEESGGGGGVTSAAAVSRDTHGESMSSVPLSLWARQTKRCGACGVCEGHYSPGTGHLWRQERGE